jgi:hypothetical protein
MTTAYSSLLGLALPVTGELSGTWGDMVDNGITQYVDISVAGTVTLTNDGAVTLSNTNGTSAATNIVSSLTGAGTASAQFAIIKVTGTLTTPKVITAPSTSKTFLIVNSATGSTVTLKASGQTGISIAVAETALAYFNGTDYVKVSSTVSSTNVASITFGSTGLTPSTATTGAVTVAGTLANTNGGTGQSSAFAQYGITYASTTTVLATTAAGTSTTVLHGNASGAPTFGAVSLTADVTGTLPVANGGTGLATLTAGYIPYGNGTSAFGNESNLSYDATNNRLGVVGTGYSPNIALTDAATVAWDTTTGQVATFTFVSTNRTMGAPTGLVSGAFYALAVIQNAGSNTLTWNSVFKWANGTAPTLSTAAAAQDYFVFRSNGTNLYEQGRSQGVA